jgi:tetratricopeptide (TPR) repeat protein
MQDLVSLRDSKPDLAEARVGLARVMAAKHQADPALAELAKAVELKPDLAEAHYQIGWVQYVLKGNAAGAVAEYERAAALDSGNVEYRTSLGAALSDAKQFDRAIVELTKVTGLAGYARPEGFIYLGRAYVGARRYKDGLAPLNKAVEIAPQSADAWATLGWCYFGLKDAENFKKSAGQARGLGYKEPTLLNYLQRVEGGEAIK